MGLYLGTFKQGVSKHGAMTYAWRPGSQYDVAATRGADSVLASVCREQLGRPSTRRGCRICVTVRLPVRPRKDTMHWQANTNTPLSVTPLLNVPYVRNWGRTDAAGFCVFSAAGVHLVPLKGWLQIGEKN